MRADFRLTLLPPDAALLEPGPGIDPSRPEPSIEAIIARLQGAGVQTLYYDLADVAVVDSAYLGYLNHLARACRSLHVRMVCIHLRPEAAYGLAGILDERERAFETAHGVQARDSRIRRSRPSAAPPLVNGPAGG